MQAHDLNSPGADPDSSVHDLGPLAWVLDELRKSLDGSAKALKRFVREAEAAKGSGLATPDASHLRIAGQQLHQAVGALEMVGLAGPAPVLRAMEAAVQRFVQQPGQCSQDAASTIESASFALTEYLEAVLADKPISAVSLFPQYRDVQELVRADRIHPADLWPLQWRWLEPELALTTEPRNDDVQARTAFDQSVLQVMKGRAPLAADTLKGLSLAFSARQADRRPRIFWKIAAAYFEALAHDLLPSDVYVRRAASRVLLQYASLSKGDVGVSERLAQDLLFFCSQAIPASPVHQPVLTAVRAVYGLAQFKPVDYMAVQFGRFDPALLAQARKRIASAKQTWSSICAGDTTKFQTVADQFGLVSGLLVKLHPSSEPLAQALTGAIDMTVRSGQAPPIELAMEVATSVLYLEAAFDDLDPNDPQLTQRTLHLAERLDRVKEGAKAQPLEPWMEDLYGRVSDKQTMGSIVGELRVSLGELEKSLDMFFRNPQDKAVLASVPGQLAQMRAVLSVLGLDQASHAVSLMRNSVEQMLETELDEERARAAGTFDRLGNNLGALSFLIDMLNYQPALAKKLFVYDDVKGELKPLMGRAEKVQSLAPEASSSVDALSQEVISAIRQANSGASDENLTVKLDGLATHAALAGQVGLANTAHEASVAASTNDSNATAQALNTMATAIAPAPIAATSQVEEVDFQEDDLRDIFLEEAREVIANGQDATRLLAKEPAEINQLAVLRRVFHTLKGSSRMVGLHEFGEAAWAMEQLFNSWLAEQKPVSEQLLQLSAESLTGLSRWIEDIVAHHDDIWSACAFRASAEAMRIQGRYLALVLPRAVSAPAEVCSDAPTDTQPDAPAIDFPAERLDIRVEPIATVFAPGLDVYPEASTGELGDADVDVIFVEPNALDMPDVPEIAGIDFDSLSALSGVPHALEPSAGDIGTQFAAASLPVPEKLATPAPSLAVQTPPNDEDQVKVIGHLRIGIPLYNVYLNEADEWSRRLVTEVTEWAMERSQPVADSTVSFAHSLAGSSATVGLVSVSDMARALEHALHHSQAHDSPAAAQQYAGLFIRAAEDIRRLLHQFAAGFLKKADADVLAQLLALDFSAIEVERKSAIESLPVSPASEPLAPASALTLPLAAVSPGAAVASRTFAQAASPQEPPAPGFFDDDEIDAVDAIDAELFPMFDEEAAELMPQLGGALRQWSARPDNLGARMEVLRALHTLKGSARLAGALRLGDMAHRMESEIEFLGSNAVQTQDFEALLARFDAMQNTLEVLRRADASHAAAAFTEPSEAALKAEMMAEQMADETTASVAGFAASSPPPVLGKGMVPAPQIMARQLLPQAASASIRVRSQLLDRMINQAGEVMITRSRLEAELNQLRGSLGDMTDNLNRLRTQLRDIEFQAETQMQSRLAQAKELQAGFDPLEFDRFTRVQELTRMMAESVNDVATVQRTLQRTVEATEDDLIAQARQTRELQRDLLRTRMVEFESISDRLYRVVRQASKDTGKQVKLDLLGATIEMDRGMLDRMTPSFEHLLRNCIAHGIESPAVRSAAGKNAAGVITVELRQEGNDVSVRFSDDGAGLDLARIREKAISSGLVQADQPMDDQQVVNLIFRPGFTTAAQVTELSGRGIGLDVVLSEVNSVGGRIETTTVAGQGTQFKLVLPLTTAVTQVVMIRSGSLAVGVPANVVETVRRSTAKELQQAYNYGSLDVADDTVPFFWSGALLQSSAQSCEVQGKTAPVVIFRSAAQRVALHVDEVLGNQEVVVKNLGPQLSRLPGLAGMSVLASGAVVLIYNPVALASVYGDQARALSGDSAEPHMLETPGIDNGKPAPMVVAPPQMPLVMVVDDSITVRRVTQRLLQREGFRVVIAADGVQALERLREELPVVVLSDIEMPRMDGFDLARNIRGDARLARLPIVMITSRIAEKHREHAKELGVDHYLGKPYAEEELIGLVRHYCGLDEAA
jgi:chemosensory pili system protein ChpA (sensor histidine kinase/response regulator)